MKWLGRLFIIAILLFLVVTALNVSNEAINQLTMQNRGAVMGAEYDNEAISIHLMGNNYEYGVDKLQGAANSVKSITEKWFTIIVQHFIKCYKIFCAVFL